VANAWGRKKKKGQSLAAPGNADPCPLCTAGGFWLASTQKRRGGKRRGLPSTPSFALRVVGEDPRGGKKGKEKKSRFVDLLDLGGPDEFEPLSPS